MSRYKSTVTIDSKISTVIFNFSSKLNWLEYVCTFLNIYSRNSKVLLMCSSNGLPTSVLSTILILTFLAQRKKYFSKVYYNITWLCYYSSIRIIFIIYYFNIYFTISYSEHIISIISIL